MTGRKPGTRKSAAKSEKKLKLNKRTLKDLAPAKSHAVQGGRAMGTFLDCITDAIKTATKTGAR